MTHECALLHFLSMGLPPYEAFFAAAAIDRSGLDLYWNTRVQQVQAYGAFRSKPWMVLIYDHKTGLQNVQVPSLT